MKVLVTGASGLIGSRLVDLNKDFDLLTPSSKELDITNFSSTQDYIQHNMPEIIINCAAFTDTARAEQDSTLVIEVNREGVRNLIRSIANINCTLVQVSTDWVFDGTTGNYKEEDHPHPQTRYGRTKLEAEELVQESRNPWLIVRTSYPYRSHYENKSDAVRWMIPKLERGEEITLVNDRSITPTFVDDFVTILFDLIKSNAEGIYHVAGRECLSFYEMGLVVCDVWEFDKKLIKGVSMEEFKKSSGRAVNAPQKSCLNTDKLKSQYGFVLSDFKTGLVQMRQQMEVM